MADLQAKLSALAEANRHLADLAQADQAAYQQQFVTLAAVTDPDGLIAGRRYDVARYLDAGLGLHQQFDVWADSLARDSATIAQIVAERAP